MVDVFKFVDKFFISLSNYLTFNYIFLIFVGLFLFTVLNVIFFTSRSYEARLIKAIDKFNVYFIDNPHINEENLVAFNAKMKDKKVPKQLRKNWQQFVLYREDKASTYMSFENCVSKPIKNSTYTRDLKLMNHLAWIFAICSLILNVYYCFETSDLTIILRNVLLTPIIILFINYFAHIFLNLRHSAIVSDLYQNYQYFEVNIDKATETLPEYVDYEVLFDRNEIKKGIPILYAYLQKRAEEEQRELEMARIKNIEHEKFNFDDQGVAASLVLERAMHEAENYIAERKKYTQDTQQINEEMTQEDMNYREITKEYNRQMQVSKETFANFKAQLEDVSSSIEANYLKKQQQQELDRQRNLERDFDAATERHKKVIESYNAELDAVDKFIAQSRQNLENAMKSEFNSYSSKVYDEAKKLVEIREKNKFSKMKQNITELEEALVSKNQELEEAYEQNQVMNDKLLEIGIVINDQPVSSKRSSNSYKDTKDITEFKPQTNIPAFNEDIDKVINEVATPENETYEFEDVNQVENIVENIKQDIPEEDFNLNEEISTEQTDDSINKVVSRRGRPKKVVDTVEEEGEKKRPGRPRKEVASTKPKRSVGRPRKKAVEQTGVGEKRGRGRPRKEEVESALTERRGRGRPRKEEAQSVKVGEKRGRGRPRKEDDEPVLTKKRGRGRPRKEEVKPIAVGEKRGRGRPRKEEIQSVDVKEDFNSAINNESVIPEDIDAYLKEIDNAIAEENAKLEETQKELEKNTKLKRKK